MAVRLQGTPSYITLRIPGIHFITMQRNRSGPLSVHPTLPGVLETGCDPEVDTGRGALRTGALLPASPSFAGHQTFAMRSGWLKKGLDALQSPEAGAGALFTREDALVTLGVGKNMTVSIRHWLLTTRMARECVGASGRLLEPTPLGNALFGTPRSSGWDPFLEDDATLWLLHWLLTGPGSRAFSWVWIFHFFREYEFTRETLTDAVFRAAVNRVARPPSRATIERDVQCFLHTYVAPEGSGAVSEDSLDCPLSALGLIRPGYSAHYRFQIGSRPTLPPAIFCYALSEFWEWKYPGGQALSLWDIAYAEGSPGVAFKLDEDTVLAYLDRIEETTQGAWRFEDTVLVRQVVRARPEPVDGMYLLREYYNRKQCDG